MLPHTSQQCHFTFYIQIFPICPAQRKMALESTEKDTIRTQVNYNRRMFAFISLLVHNNIYNTLLNICPHLDFAIVQSNDIYGNKKRLKYRIRKPLLQGLRRHPSSNYSFGGRARFGPRG
jgi:hypothetical protein